MTRNIFLIFLAVAFVCTEGHESENRRLVSASNGFRDAEDKLFSSHDKILWMGQSSTISLRVKDAAHLKTGTTGKLYYTVRTPPKIVDRQLRKKSGVVHKSVKHGVSRTDGLMRRGTMAAHDLVKQGIISLDSGLARGSKIAHDKLKQSSSWLDNKLVEGSKKTHSTVKYGTKSVDRGVKQGSIVAYRKVRKGMALVDRQIQSGVKAVDKQLTGKMTGVPVKFFLNQFVSSKRLLPKKKSKDSSPSAVALSAPPEPEPATASETATVDAVENEAIPTEFETATADAVENEAIPKEVETAAETPTRFSSTESIRSEEGENDKTFSPHHEETEGEQFAHHEWKEDDHVDTAKGEEPKSSHFGDDHDHFEDQPYSDHDIETGHPEEANHNYGGEPRTIKSRARKGLDYHLNKLNDNKIKQMMPRAFPKMNPRTMTSKMTKKLPRSFSKINSGTVRAASKVKIPNSLSKIRVPRSLKAKYKY